jgi:hypothetical protein
MAPPTRTPKCSRYTIEFVVALTLLHATTVRATEPDTTNPPNTPTHREFVDSCRADLAATLLKGFTPNRTRPIYIIPDTTGDSVQMIAGHLSKLLSDRGLLVRDSSSDHAEDGNWTLRYTLDPLDLTLSEPQRQSMLGKIWLKRTLNAGLNVAVLDDAEGEEVWSGDADSTYQDWIRKSDLERLESDGLSPEAPLTGWEKARLPLLLGGGAVVAGTFMLLLN